MSQATRDSLLSADDNRRMFDRIARRYDRMNTLLSLGQDRRWRRRAVQTLAPRAGGRYLDVGCGTGDMALEIARQAPGASIVGIDPAADMLAVAASKIGGAGLAGCISFQVADGLAMPFEDRTFDGLVSAFCIRNMTDRAKAFAEMRRVLKRAAPAVILELSVPPNGVVRAGHYLYSRCVVPVAGGLLARSTGAYRYLVDSIMRFPRPRELQSQMAAAGFSDVRCGALGLGTVIVLSGRAP
ncbi:MAG: ubiquinone/menaquinone biosynthesis methyltransferase [Planctomycetaceae bacterium]|nr:ubiquinone/menaquinone biosynthesis methyltransferase [Planctomycetaceae bacterium]